MTWIYVWTSEIKNIYVWTTPVKEVYVWTTKVRPRRLPSAYQEVEYIQSSGTQYFIIWNTFKTSYKSVIDFQMITIGSDYVPLWVRNADHDPNYRYWIDAWNSYFKIISWWNNWTSTIREDKNRHSITVDKSTATVDGTNYSISYVNYTFSDWIWVFYYHSIDWKSWYYASIKLYKLDIYDENWNHIFDGYPCYRKSDSVIWMYDVVWQQFYTNQWTWTFTKWPNV